MNNQTNTWNQPDAGNQQNTWNQSNAGNQQNTGGQLGTGIGNQSVNEQRLGNNQVNSSIGCIVTECEYHAHSENYCTLNHIHVVKHEPNAKTVECTDCGSFNKHS